jgi:hypothetical protein
LVKAELGGRKKLARNHENQPAVSTGSSSASQALREWAVAPLRNSPGPRDPCTMVLTLTEEGLQKGWEDR